MQKLTERKHLTPKMREAVEYYIVHPTATRAEVSRVIGVHYQTLNNWCHSDIFQDELQKRLKEEWRDSVKIAQKAIIDQAKEGNLRAAEYICDCNGYQAPQKIEVDSSVIKVTIDD